MPRTTAQWSQPYSTSQTVTATGTPWPARPNNASQSRSSRYSAVTRNRRRARHTAQARGNPEPDRATEDDPVAQEGASGRFPAALPFRGLRPVLHEGRLEVADAEAVAVAERGRAADLPAVDPGAAAAVQVL